MTLLQLWLKAIYISAHGNAMVTLTATAPLITNPVFRWYASQTATTLLHTGSTYTFSPNTDTTLYVSVSGTGYCENLPEKRKEVTVIVFPIPDAPTLLTDTLPAYRWMPIDLSTAVNLLPGLWYNFYSDPAGTDLLGSTVVFDPPKDDYYVSARNEYCEGALTKIILKDPCPETIKDDEDNEYTVTSLSGRCWTENLRSTQYPGTGDPIPFSVYTCNGCPARLDTIFGLLYTWYAAVGSADSSAEVEPQPNYQPNYQPIQGICPDGWHIPTQEEWNRLNNYATSQLNSTQYWLNPPGGGTDEFGFNALPAGWYNSTINRYQDLYGFTDWWASDAPAGTATATTFAISY